MLHSISDSLAIARELLKQILINLVKLGAAQLADHVTHKVGDRVEKTQEQPRLLPLRRSAALKIPPVRSVMSTPVKLSKRKRLRSRNHDGREGGKKEKENVPANVKELRVQGSGVEDICVEVVEFVRRPRRPTTRTSAAIERLTLVGSIAAGLSIDSEPALDDVVAELSRRRLLTVVGHEAVDEGVCCGLHQDTGEWAVKEVRVGLLLGVETLSTEGGQRLHRDEATG
ncbi:hypothetical protein KC339_g76 [Hortaea werneckii]|nr:hypothetical protein KC339_g76 [Hortaea werneckii]